jgi:hypothetical protein
MVADAENGGSGAFRVGEISGRMTALQNRMDKLESEVSARLDRMDTKLDLLMQGQARYAGIETERSQTEIRHHWFIGMLLGMLTVGVTLLGVIISHRYSIG